MIFLTFVLLFLILPLVLALALDSLIRGHDLTTSKRATKALAAIIQKHNPGAKNFYDLGCARGTLLLRLKKIFPHLDIYGIDNSALRVFFAKLKSIILRRKIKFQKQDIFKIDLHRADVIYTYLWYDLMPVLEKKLQKELKHGAIVITNTTHFQDWQPIEKVVTYPNVSKTPNFETLFVYFQK